MSCTPGRAPATRARPIQSLPSQTLSRHPGNPDYPGKLHTQISWAVLVAFHTSPYPEVDLYPGTRAIACIRASGQNHQSWQSGRAAYPGGRVEQSIRAVGQNSLSRQSGRTIYPGSRAEHLSGQPGKRMYPGSRAELCSRASGQHNPSGHTGRTLYPSTWATLSIRASWQKRPICAQLSLSLPQSLHSQVTDPSETH